MGDFAGRDINKIRSKGNNNRNTINTGTMSIENSFDELREAIRKEYTEPDKEQVLQEVSKFEEEAKNKSDKKGLIKKVLEFAGKFAENPLIMNIIIQKIIPLLQEATKHV
jgi:hypothetical protein